MKNSLLALFLISSLYTFGQFKYQGQVRALKTKEPIAFCAIAFKGSSQGCISNEEGIFQISSQKNLDTLIITCIGYKTKIISINTFLKDPVVYLDISEFNLQEVVIYDKDDFLFKIFESCRKNLSNSAQKTAKTYYVLESSIAEQAVELLECYYNSSFNSSSLRFLEFKNGRVGLALFQNRLFVNANISKAFTFINLIGGSTDLPDNPFELNTRQLKKNYRLKLLSVSENDLYHIEFTPLKQNGEFFSGEVWIEKKSGLLKKISLNIANTQNHPFLPLHKDEGKVEDVSMQINKTYNSVNGENILDHIDFNYQLHYHHRHNSSISGSNNDTTYLVSSKGLMYFYDIGKPFILPYFRYDEELSDYRKISSLSYNEDFWNSNTSVEYSQRMKKGIQYFKKNGLLLNFKNSQSNNTALLNGGKFFENNYVMWSGDKRISLKKDKINHDTTLAHSEYGQKIKTDLYKIKAQLFLDLNPIQDSIQHYSVSIFDVYETFYHLPEEPNTNCFINIYFDLFEVERRKMEKIILKNKFSAAQFDSLYKVSVNNLEIQSRDYFLEVERGTKLKALEKWNEYVKQNLGIDNMEIFQIQASKK